MPPTERMRTAYRISIDFVNQATNVTDAEALKVMNALQKQADRDFAPHWGVNCRLNFVGKGKSPNIKNWWLLLIDNADIAGALGYHDLTDGNLPIGKVFVETTKADGGQWSATASHELLEMLVDPWINLVVFMQAGFASGTGATLVAYEVCDAPEADEFGYSIDGVLVSDFVLPAFFEPEAVSNEKLDFMGKIKKPFQLLPGGYLGILNVNGVGGWTQITASKPNMKSAAAKSQVYNALPKIGSRRERRQRGYEQFIASVSLTKKSPLKKKPGTVVTEGKGVVGGKTRA